MRKLKFDLEGKGLRTMFKPYQVAVFQHLQDQPGLGSGELWKRVNRTIEGTISRASLIFFCNDMVEEGLITYTEATGKGGYHKLYSPVQATEGALRTELSKRIEKHVIKELYPGSELEIQTSLGPEEIEKLKEELNERDPKEDILENPVRVH